MIRLEGIPKLDSFRAEFVEWLQSNPPPSVTSESSLEAFINAGRTWQRTLAAARWIGVHWPEKFGGRSLSLVEEAIIQEELGRANAPQVLGLFGLTMVGPVLIQHGSDQQRSRFLAKILAAEEIWCQGFSEPGAGSDLAAVKTRAVDRGDQFELTGQKIWTSFAQIADWCFVLSRTSDEGAKHKGLTYLLVDMRSKGITVKPLKQITGEEEFNEVFFDQVLVPKENVVGNIGDGWKIAISTLMFERVVLTFARHIQSERVLRSLMQRKDLNASQRNQLADLVAESCGIRALAYEHLIEYSQGKTPAAEGSLDKLLWSENFQAISKFALRLTGADGALSEHENTDLHRYLYSRGRTIAAGTSEIQRGIIAERLLGLGKSV